MELLFRHVFAFVIHSALAGLNCLNCQSDLNNSLTNLESTGQTTPFSFKFLTAVAPKPAVTDFQSQIYTENKSNVDETEISNTNEAQNKSAQLVKTTNILALNSNIKIERNIKIPVNSAGQQGILDLEMTPESIPGWIYQVYFVSQTTSVSKSGRCVISEKPDPYQIVPVYQAELRIHFRNPFCIPGHFLNELHSLFFWDIVLSKDCFSDMVKKLESRSYLEFLMKVLSGNQCETILVPPINSVLDTHVNIRLENTSLSRICKDGHKFCPAPRRKGQQGDGYEHICLICRWLNVNMEEFVTTHTATGVVGTYFKIVNKILQNNQVSSFDQRCLPKNCYSELCRPGELGLTKECFNPISEVYGHITTTWIKIIFNLKEPANNFDKAMTSIRDSIYERKNVSTILYIHQETTQSAENCQVTEFHFNTYEFTEYRALEEDVTIVLDVFLKKAYSLTNSFNFASFNISSEQMYCPSASNVIQNVSRNNASSIFQQIGIWFAAAAAIVCVFTVVLAGLCFKNNRRQQ